MFIPYIFNMILSENGLKLWKREELVLIMTYD
jgi:hypothetical protein